MQGLSQGRVHSSVAQVLLHLHWPSTQQLLQAALVAQLCLPLHFHRFHHQACCQRARPGRCPPAGSRSAAVTQDGLRYQYRSSPGRTGGCRNPGLQGQTPLHSPQSLRQPHKFFSNTSESGITARCHCCFPRAPYARLGHRSHGHGEA